MKRQLTLLVATVTISIATPVSYQKCMDTSDGSTHQFRKCNSDELDYQDRLLNKYYKQAMQKLAESEKSKLRKAQRAWIKYRDANCDVESAPMRGGTGERVLYGGCLVDMTTKRASELRGIRDVSSL